MRENIGDDDLVSRLINFPQRFDDFKGLIYPEVYKFASGSNECAVWRKYKMSDESVHALGVEQENRWKDRRADARYVGFVNSVVKCFRSITTKRNYGLDVIHEPEEGIHHVEVTFADRSQGRDRTPAKADRNEIRYMAQRCIKELVEFRD